MGRRIRRVLLFIQALYTSGLCLNILPEFLRLSRVLWRKLTRIWGHVWGQRARFFLGQFSTVTVHLGEQLEPVLYHR